MSATTVAAPVTAGRPRVQAIRVALIALAIVVLLGVSFVLGRATGSSAQHVPTITPTSEVQTTTEICRMGRPC